MLDTIKHARLRYLFKNFCYLLTRDLAADLWQPELRREILFQKILHLPEPWADQFREEIAYIRKHGWTAFPYPSLRALEVVQSGRDTKWGMPFVVHRDRKLYFPASWTEQKAVAAYRNYIESECLLGGDFRARAPHQYVTSEFHVCPGDTVIDVGAAEGLFALDGADRAGRLILFECDPLWQAPLRATFSSFGDVASLVFKKAGVKNDRGSVRFRDVLEREGERPLFIKMDIEGMEPALIEDALPVLARTPRVRIACCAYHRHGDAEALKRLFSSIGHRTSFSDGYMLFSRDPHQEPPYFRRGVIRAESRAFQQSPMNGAG